LDDPEEIEAGMHVLLMNSSGSIGDRMKIFMKTVDDMVGPVAIHPEIRRPLQARTFEMRVRSLLGCNPP
jgi:hypothetical protein